MSKKKIIYIAVLLVIVIGIIVFFIISGQKKNQEIDKQENSTSVPSTPISASTKETSSPTSEATQESASTGTTSKVQQTQDNTGNADIVMGDKYFDTQIADINTNFSKYEGKTIEIEGLYFENGPYTFVGRYSTSNLCPDCPAGVSYLEYEWDNENKPQLKQEDSWLKVKGQLTRGLDQGQEYYYIKVSDLQVMPEKGQTTVNN